MWEGLVNILTGEAANAPYLGGSTGRTGGVAGALKGVTDAVEGIPVAIAGIVSGVKSAWEDVQAEFDTFIENLLGARAEDDVEGSGLLGLFSTVENGLVDALTILENLIASPLSGIAAAFGTFKKDVLAFLDPIITTVKEFIGTITESADAAGARQRHKRV